MSNDMIDIRGPVEVEFQFPSGGSFGCTLESGECFTVRGPYPGEKIVITGVEPDPVVEPAWFGSWFR